MEILSWNIQSGYGCDGRLDLTRIAEDVRAFSTPDVICLQEVARNCPELDDGPGADQVETLSLLFPGFEAVFGAGFDRPGNGARDRRQFGNLVLSRLPLLQIFRHVLPSPADPDVLQMPRSAVEVVADSELGPLRLVTTHLAYHSLVQRLAQVRRLRELTAEVASLAEAPPRDRPGSPFAQAPLPVSSVICGDFNLLPGSPEYLEMVGLSEEESPEIEDAWPLVHGTRLHDPTCGLFDREHWAEGPHCRDFFFVTADLATHVQTVEVNLTSAASDHQPLRLILAP